VAQAQRQWPQAEGYYQQALQIKIDFNDRYSQASTYGQLGLLGEAQEQYDDANEYLLKALAIFVEFGDEYSQGTALRSLVRLWQAAPDEAALARAAALLKIAPADLRARFAGAAGAASEGDAAAEG
jgi:tetratricopeptide (TPR) repeat protein